MENIVMSSQFNNGALHILIPYLAAFINPASGNTKDFQFRELPNPSSIQQEAFKKTLGYQCFRNAFVAYYNIPRQWNADQIIQSLFTQYRHPLDLQVLLGPVLRIALKEILTQHQAHKADTKNAFLKLLPAIFTHCYSAKNELCMSNIDAIRQYLTRMLWSDDRDQALFNANITMIATMVAKKDLTLSDPLWEEAYLHYVEYYSDPRQCIYLSTELLVLLGKSFNFSVNGSMSDSMAHTALATIKTSNRSLQHWEIINANNSQWNFEIDPPDNRAIFRDYYEISNVHLSFGRGPEKLKIVQESFVRKIHGMLVHKQPYREETYRIFPGDQWSNNSGLEALSDLIASAVCDENTGLSTSALCEQFQKTDGFEAFLNAFRQYYALPSAATKEMILTALKKLCFTYPLAKERFMIISPVLRSMLPLAAGNQNNLCFADMVAIHLKFNFAIAMYLPNHSGIVSCYDKIHEYMPNGTILKTIAVIGDDTSWYFLKQDDPVEASFMMATKKYYDNMAFLKKEDSVSIEQRLKTLKTGISGFLNTGIPYVETYQSGLLSSRTSSALHNAVLTNDAHAVKQLLNTVNWREEVDWNAYKNRVKIDALKLAAYLDNRQIVSIILQHTIAGKEDDARIQSAYKLACYVQCTQVLPAFLYCKNLHHSFEAMKNLIATKDLALFQSLYQRGAPLFDTMSDDAGMLEYLFSVSTQNDDDPEFYKIFQDWFLFHFYQIKVRQYRSDHHSLEYSDDASGVIDRAFNKKATAWVERLLHVFIQLPDRLNLEDSLSEIMLHNYATLVEMVAKHACRAISDDNKALLNECLHIAPFCIETRGRYNPLHHAFQTNKYDNVKKIVIDYFINERLPNRIKDPTVPVERALMRKVEAHYQQIVSSVVDQYDRTLEFRLNEQNKREAIRRAIPTSSWRQYFELQLYNIKYNTADKLAVYVADRAHAALVHNAKVQNTLTYKIGYGAQTFARTVGTLSTEGVLRAGLDLGARLLHNKVSQLIHWSASNIGAYVAPYVGWDPVTGSRLAAFFSSNAISFALSPKYYVVSTAFTAINQCGFRDSGYLNCEAFCQIALDSLAYNIAFDNTELKAIDERYYHRLLKNLSPFVGEYGASIVSPVIAGVDVVSNYFNAAINYPIVTLHGYMSQSFIETFEQCVSSVPTTFENIPYCSTLAWLGSSAKTAYEAVKHLNYQRNIFSARCLNYLETAILNNMGDSFYKSERLHAFQIFETNCLSAEVGELKKSIENAKKYNDSEAVARLQTALEQKESALKEATAVEETLFKKTQGYTHFETWQEKYLALKLGNTGTPTSAEEKERLQAEEKSAREQSYFYNSDIINKSSDLWVKSVDDLFEKNKHNFPDWTNGHEMITGIINDAFNSYTDRNRIAQYCANMIIRYKYPLYPDIGDATVIEAEREALINEISTYELQGLNRRPDRCQSRLYDYILAKLTNTEKKQHVHRVDRAYQHFEKKMFKPFVNDVFYIVTFGKWVPFKRSPIGMTPGIGGMSGVGGLQFNYGFGGGLQLYISAGSNPYMLYDSKANRQDNLPAIRMVPQPVFAPVRFPISEVLSPVDSALVIPVVSNPGMSIDNPYLQSAINDFYQETFPSIRTENTTKGKSVAPRKAPCAVTQKAPLRIPTNPSVSSAPAEASYHFRESTLKQRTSYRDEYSNDLGTGKKILISVGRQLVQTAQGVKQFGLETGEKLGVVKKGAAAQYTAVVNEEKQVYDSTPVAKSIPGKVGQYGTEMLIAAALPASTGLKAAKLIAASAGTGAALGGVQVTEEGTLAARGKNAAVGAAVGAGGALVISKASAAIKAAANKIGAATKASKKPPAILNQYNLRPRTSSPNYVGGSTKSTTRTSASKPGLPLTQYENVKIVNSHATTNSSHNASNANASKQVPIKLTQASITPAFDQIKSFSVKAELDGAFYPKEKLTILVNYLEKRGVHVYGTNGSPCFVGRENGVNHIYLPENPTVLQVKHELSHWLDFKNLGYDAYSKSSVYQREKMVLDRLQSNRLWQDLNQFEKDFSVNYVEKIKQGYKPGGLP